MTFLFHQSFSLRKRTVWRFVNRFSEEILIKFVVSIFIIIIIITITITITIVIFVHLYFYFYSFPFVAFAHSRV